MLQLILTVYTPLIELQDCFSASEVFLLPKTKQIRVELSPILISAECQIIKKGVQFNLTLKKTSTDAFAPVFTRSKDFVFGETNTFLFASNDDLSKVTLVELSLSSMTHMTNVLIGSVQIDTSISNDCFKDILLNLTEKVVLTMTATGFCDHLSTGKISQITVPDLGLQKLPETGNSSVFLTGFADFTKTLQIEFQDNLLFSKIELGISSDIDFQMQLNIGEIEYLVVGFIDQAVGKFKSDFAENFTALSDSNSITLFYNVKKDVENAITALKINTFSLQLGIKVNGTWLYSIFKAQEEDLFLNQLQFDCMKLCNINFEDMELIQLNVVGIQDDKVKVFFNNTISSFRQSSFQQGNINFVGRFMQVTFKQNDVTDQSTFTTSLYVNVTVSMLVDGQLTDQFITEDTHISPETRYVNLACFEKECLNIREFMSKKMPESIQIQFFRNSEQTPFDALTIHYNTAIQVDFITLVLIVIGSVIICGIWAIVQLYLDYKGKKVIHKRKIIKKPDMDDVI
ncbi:hypothetical protein SS50377_26010 [Spironucleus salmonicida]|uniref:Uncharacterized protein n=1 Tax=Spironucleus salmonicida TaxID=348837 RepID=V6LJK2_9EUKA|nr:hypothetical protein SS50377_26010 [Spironucleus salmonicida]|eukprot:EST44770.1 Hypothetical protein SS50377_15340 [Spironucleus salmonicida]